EPALRVLPVDGPASAQGPLLEYPTVGPLPFLRQSRRRAAPVDQLPGTSLEMVSTGLLAPAPSRTPLSPSQLPDPGPSLPVTRPSSPLAAIRPASHAVGRTDSAPGDR